ncbi:hypothetical protein [Salinimonas chungwhensis]|uniref:hypothetical protein n=1 Tax=Salinimonas chungwhensis TaxID=265425 RepID=UPI00036EDC2B|nr:hypothetical protein [Salinimonas chungwhensis]
MDLFKVCVKEKRLHPLFKSILSESAYAPTIKVINQWATGMAGRRGELKKFVQEFQMSFNSTLWELYLNQAFRDLQLTIDYSKESPDFHLIDKAGRVVNVEAVTSNNKDHQSKEYYSTESLQSSSDTEQKEFLDQSTLKLAGKLKDKLELFVSGNKKFPYSSLPHVKGNPFVLAIAPFDGLLSFQQNNMAVNRVLYGINPPPPSGNGDRIDHILNQNRQRVELGIFTNASYKEVSAVIFSTTGTFGKAVVEAGIKNTIRATRYRQMGVVEFMAKEGLEMLGASHKKLPSGSDVYSIRFYDGNRFCGSDTYLYSSDEHEESHLDRLHIYHNPYATTPLPDDFFSAREITQNTYNVEGGYMICNHNDGSLVSRQTYTSIA